MILLFILLFIIFIIFYLINYDNFESTNHQIIPLKLWQTWHTKDLLPNMKECVELLKKQNPEFEYNLYDDNDCRMFIINHFNKNVIDAYDTLIPGAFKADLWRYCVLYIHGGVYLDIKYKCAKDFKLISIVDREHYVKDRIWFGTDFGIYNAFMVCKPNNKMLMNCINQIVENVKNRYYGEHTVDVSGPRLLNRFMADEDRNEIIFNFDGDNICYKKDNKIILEKYPEYISEYIKPHYVQLWYNRNIYNESN